MIIRRATPHDEPALRRLAALDSKRPPKGDALVAEIDGQIHAAIGLADGTAIADPFKNTAELVELLQMRAQQLTAPQPSRPTRLLRARSAPADA
jgi:hypothetical protein